MSIYIDENICNGCKGLPEARCERICPGNLCYRKDTMKAAIRDQSACWTCACCVKECPVQAIELRLPFQICSDGASLKARQRPNETVWTIRDAEGNQEIFVIPARRPSQDAVK
ncbi:MAG: adenylylsulfate reductase [Candidatus Brocadiaceae bacterium]|nr:adenylylsulfate reductase [Candidatus Brocadiaceae bacterium]